MLFVSTCVLANVSKEYFTNVEDQQESILIPDYERVAITQWVNKHRNVKINLNVDELITSVFKHSIKNNVDPYLVFGLMKKESSFNPSVISSGGAIGLTQVIPYWHPQEVNKRNLKDQEISTEVGVLVIKKYINKFKGNISKALKYYSGSATNYYENVTRNSNSLKSHIKTYELAYQQANYRLAYFDITKTHLEFEHISVEAKIQKFDLEFTTFLDLERIEKEKSLNRILASINQ
jgi:membrane-bound lytic murein transglycosylase MltF